MKKYEKPVLVAFSLTSTDMLCGCAIDAMGDNMDPMLAELLKQMGEEITSGSFASIESCTDILDVTGYCKHSPSPEGIVFAS